MNITLHTEPSVRPPEFTIICHTEGGPVTQRRVLWLGPDGIVEEDSDHETSQIIVDTSHNSVYENKLRVRGREGGMYTCIITNQYFLELTSLVQGDAIVMGL